MGNLASPEALIARWAELCHDSSLRDLPYKVELNARGKIELTPRTNRRARLVAELAAQLHQLSRGVSLISCGVLTKLGVNVVDVLWASDELMAVYHDAMLFERAPEICAEVCTPDGEEKVGAYLAAGAREVWLVSEDGAIRYFDSAGERSDSRFPISIALPPPMK